MPKLSFLILALTLFVGPTTLAHADLTLKIHESFGDPPSNIHSKAALSFFDGFHSIEYISGTNVRTEGPGSGSVICDESAHVDIFLNDHKRTYCIVPRSEAPTDDPKLAQLRKSLSAAKMVYKVTDTGKTTTMLGHPVRHYIVMAELTLDNKKSKPAREDVLTATDITGPDVRLYIAHDLDPAEFSAIRGLPLAITMSDASGKVWKRIEITSISFAAVPGSLFKVPPGYKETKEISFGDGSPLP